MRACRWVSEWVSRCYITSVRGWLLPLNRMLKKRSSLTLQITRSLLLFLFLSLFFLSFFFFILPLSPSTTKFYQRRKKQASNQPRYTHVRRKNDDGIKIRSFVRCWLDFFFFQWKKSRHLKTGSDSQQNGIAAAAKKSMLLELTKCWKKRKKRLWSENVSLSPFTTRLFENAHNWRRSLIYPSGLELTCSLADSTNLVRMQHLALFLSLSLSLSFFLSLSLFPFSFFLFLSLSFLLSLFLSSLFPPSSCMEIRFVPGPFSATSLRSHRCYVARKLECGSHVGKAAAKPSWYTKVRLDGESNKRSTWRKRERERKRKKKKERKKERKRKKKKRRRILRPIEKRRLELSDRCDFKVFFDDDKSARIFHTHTRRNKKSIAWKKIQNM